METKRCYTIAELGIFFQKNELELFLNCIFNQVERMQNF